MSDLRLHAEYLLTPLLKKNFIRLIWPCVFYLFVYFGPAEVEHAVLCADLQQNALLLHAQNPLLRYTNTLLHLQTCRNMCESQSERCSEICRVEQTALTSIGNVLHNSGAKTD